jgi:hypothetical protein
MIQDKQVEERKEEGEGTAARLNRLQKGATTKGEDTGVASPSMSAWI